MLTQPTRSGNAACASAPRGPPYDAQPRRRTEDPKQNVLRGRLVTNSCANAASLENRAIDEKEKSDGGISPRVAGGFGFGDCRLRAGFRHDIAEHRDRAVTGENATVDDGARAE